MDNYSKSFIKESPKINTFFCVGGHRFWAQNYTKTLLSSDYHLRVHKNLEILNIKKKQIGFSQARHPRHRFFRVPNYRLLMGVIRFGVVSDLAHCGTQHPRPLYKYLNRRCRCACVSQRMLCM